MESNFITMEGGIETNQPINTTNITTFATIQQLKQILQKRNKLFDNSKSTMNRVIK